jgi:hypothetical protein
MENRAEEQRLALEAFIALYTEWENAGGPSPSVGDEARAIARAIDTGKTLTDDQVEDIYVLHTMGATETTIVEAHLAALRGEW